jgi:DNA-directed RNA polymerase specialized sigma24 family protein
MTEASEQTDDALLSAARGGDRPALEALLERYQARIYRYGLRMCGDPEDARDVLQDTMLALARRVGSLQAAGALPTWLYTVARRSSGAAADRRRARSTRRRQPPTRSPIPAVGPRSGSPVARSSGRWRRPSPRSIRSSATCWCCATSKG